MERVLEDLLFKASEIQDSSFSITAEYVREQLTEIIRDEDLSRFIL
jgi:ATP-dependent HslUV protease ATP-binding subunit HslU